MVGWDLTQRESPYQHTPDNVDYYSALPNIERKRWLAEEVYRRSKIGVKLLTED